MRQQLYTHYLLLILLVVYFLFALFTYKDYGISADEKNEYYLGSLLQKDFFDHTAFTTEPRLLKSPHLKYYYHLYPMILSILNFKGYYEWFHLLNMLFASVIIVAAYALFYFEYRNMYTKAKYLACIAPLVILLTPQFLGHIPINPKDMPFAVMYFVSIALIYIFNRQQKFGLVTKCIILGLVFGFTQSLRIIGYSVYVLYIFDLLTNKQLFTKQTIVKKLLELVYVGLIAQLFMYLTFPYLRENIFNIFTLAANAGRFSPWDRDVLYMGTFITRDQRPWHYVVVYILLTTPVIITALHFYALNYLKKNALVRLLMVAICINIGLYLAVHPIIYNGLRHFLFLLPLIAATAALVIAQTLRSHHFAKFAYTALFVPVFLHMVMLHPYQYAYFNLVASTIFDVEKTFETDYWGIAYKEATQQVLRYIEKNNVANDAPTSASIIPKVYPCNVAYAVSYYAQGKVTIVNKSKDADIIICDAQEEFRRQHNQNIIGIVSRQDLVLNTIRSNLLQ